MPCPLAAEVSSSPEPPGWVRVPAVKWTCSAVDPSPSVAEDSMGDAMFLCAPDTCAGTSSPFLSVRPICRGLQIGQSVYLLYPPPACISLIAITCLNWPINRICVCCVCAERGGCWIQLQFYDSQVTLVTRLRDGQSEGANPGRDKRLLSSPKYPHRLLGSPSLIFSGCRIFAPGYSGRVDHLPSSSFTVKNEWSLTPSPAVCLFGMDSDTFTLTFISKNALQSATLYKVKHQMVPRKRVFYFPSRYVTSVVSGLCLASSPSVTRRSQCTCLLSAGNSSAW